MPRLPSTRPPLVVAPRLARWRRIGLAAVATVALLGVPWATAVASPSPEFPHPPPCSIGGLGGYYPSPPGHIAGTNHINPNCVKLAQPITVPTLHLATPTPTPRH